MHFDELITNRLSAHRVELGQLPLDELELVEGVAPVLVELLAAVSDDPSGRALRITAGVLRAYGDVAEAYAIAHAGAGRG